MNLTDIEERWAPYEHIYSYDKVKDKVNSACNFMGEALDAILPSITLGADGPILQSVVVTTKKYICEIRLSPAESDFDVALLKSVGNYRVYIGSQTIIREEPTNSNDPSAPKSKTKIIYQIARIELQHIMHLKTQLHFVGEDRDRWLADVFKSLPLSTLIASVSPELTFDQLLAKKK